MVGDDAECVVIDAPHSVAEILALVGDRTVRAILCTHAHDDHVRVAPALREEVRAPIMLHPADRRSGSSPTPTSCGTSTSPTASRSPSAAPRSRALHTPGHAPGAVCFYAPDLGCVFTGDTLFQGGPGATGRSFSDADLIKESIRAKLFALPDETVVHTGHGDDTTIGAERAALGGGLRRTAAAAPVRPAGPWSRRTVPYASARGRYGDP